MTDTFEIRPFEIQDQSAVIALWDRCNLSVSWNDPKEDIEMKLQVQPELFFVGTLSRRIVASAMAGYDGHRGWIYYLAVDPGCRKLGFGRKIMEKAEQSLRTMGCRKINLQVRHTNQSVIAFYTRLGFSDDRVMGLGKRI